MSKVAHVAGVSERTLERLFMSHLGMTPSVYLRVCRLHQARKELAKVSASDKSISRIALDQGFTHLGRFSLAYRGFLASHPVNFVPTRTRLPTPELNPYSRLFQYLFINQHFFHHPACQYPGYANHPATENIRRPMHAEINAADTNTDND